MINDEVWMKQKCSFTITYYNFILNILFYDSDLQNIGQFRPEDLPFAMFMYLKIKLEVIHIFLRLLCNTFVLIINETKVHYSHYNKSCILNVLCCPYSPEFVRFGVTATVLIYNYNLFQQT